MQEMKTAHPVPRGGLYAEKLAAEAEAAEAANVNVASPTTPAVPVVLTSGQLSACDVVEACYEAHKQKWNTPPPPAPRTVVDVIKKALKEAGY